MWLNQWFHLEMNWVFSQLPLLKTSESSVRGKHRSSNHYQTPPGCWTQTKTTTFGHPIRQILIVFGCCILLIYHSASATEHLTVNVRSFPLQDVERLFVLVDVSSADRDEVGEGSVCGPASLLAAALRSSCCFKKKSRQTDAHLHRT